MFSSLEIATVDSTLLPSDETRANLIQMMVEVQTEEDPNTIGKFVSQLRKMLDNLVKAQAKHKEVHSKMMKQCETENKFRKKEVGDAKAALNAASLHRSKCKKSLKNAMKTLPELKFTLKTYKEELERAIKTRNQENKKYRERKADYEEAILFLGDFIKYVRKKLKGHFKTFSLAQYSQKLLQHSTHLGLLSEAVPVLVAIAEASYSNEERDHDYSYKPNEAVATKLKNLLSELRLRQKADLKQNDKEETKALRLFTAYKARLLKIINTLKKNIKKVKAHIVVMDRCVTTESKIVKSASKKLNRNATLKKNAGSLCSSFNKEYIDATKNRLDEIKTMNEILKIVQKRFKSLPKDLVGYLESIEDGFKQYVNSTQFKKFEAYQRKAILRNFAGEKLVSKKNLI